MNIRTQLHLLILLALMVVGIVTSTLIITTRQFNAAVQENEVASAIHRQLVDLSLVTSDYLLHDSAPARRQWQAAYGHLALDVAQATFHRSSDQTVAARLEAHVQELHAVFAALSSGRPVSPELRQQSIRQMNGRLQAIASDVGQLIQTSGTRMQQVRHYRLIVVVAAVVVVIVFLLGMAWELEFAVVRPLRRLQAGTEVIGRGRLDFPIGTPAHDELGELSRSFDAMLGRLQALTVSRDVLAAEVVQRRRVEEELQLFFTVTPDLSCFADFQGHFTKLSPAWSRTLGWTEAELLAKPFVEFVHPEDRESTRHRAAELATGGQVINFDNRYLSREGSYRWLSWNAVSLPERQLIVAVARDVTDRKHEQAELARSNQELEMFAYVASHDLQEPLRSVAGFMELLQRQFSGRLDAKADEYITFAVDGAKRMQALINGLLEYSRVNTRGKPLAEVDTAAVLAEVLANLQSAIVDAGAVVTQDQPLPVLQADAGQFARLLQNLIANALKFRRDQPPRIHVGVRRTAAGWEFAVRDNGIGIARESFDRLFVIFQRLHTPQQYPGTGLGLAICKRIVERHGGRIWVESTLGHGSTFIFTIPAVSDETLGL